MIRRRTANGPTRALAAAAVNHENQTRRTQDQSSLPLWPSTWTRQAWLMTPKRSPTSRIPPIFRYMGQCFAKKAFRPEHPPKSTKPRRSYQSRFSKRILIDWCRVRRRKATRSIRSPGPKTMKNQTVKSSKKCRARRTCSRSLRLASPTAPIGLRFTARQQRVFPSATNTRPFQVPGRQVSPSRRSPRGQPLCPGADAFLGAGIRTEWSTGFQKRNQIQRLKTARTVIGSRQKG